MNLNSWDSWSPKKPANKNRSGMMAFIGFLTYLVEFIGLAGGIVYLIDRMF